MPRLFLCCSMTLAILFASMTVPLAAQDYVRRERARSFVENLLRSVVESRMESQQARPVVVQQAIPVSPEMVRVRKHLTAWGSECDNLIQDVRVHSNRAPRLLSLLGDLIQVRANINVLQQQCNSVPTIEPIRQQVVVLDRDWRLLRHHLNQLELNQECSQCVNRCHTQHEQLCDVFQLEPQFCRRELERFVGEQHAAIQHLIQDIYYGCRDNPDLPSLLQDGRALQARIERYLSSIKRGSYDQIVSAHKDCRAKWRRFSHKALMIASERIRHDVCHIESLSRQATDLLMLPVEFDREYTGDVCGWVDDEVDQILREITLADLLECEKPVAVIAAARTFRKRCNTFGAGIRAEKRPFDRLCSEFGDLDTAWMELNTQCRGLSNQDITHRLDEIQYTMGVLQPTFGTAPEIPHWQLINMSAELSQMAGQIHLDVDQFDSSGYRGNAYNNLCKQCDDLHVAAGGLHTMIVQKPRADYRPQMKKCFKQWVDVRNLMKKCPQQDRRQLAAYRGQIEPLMAKLQLVYAD